MSINHEILYRILRGVNEISLANTNYTIRPPTLEVLYKANKLYNEIYRRESFNDEWLSAKETERLLVGLSIIPPAIDDVIKNMTTQQEDIKVGMFKSYLKKDTLDLLRKRLNMLKKKFSETINNKHLLDYITAEGYAIMLKNQYILVNTLYKEDKLVFNNLEEAPYKTLDDITGILNSNYVSVEEIRKISRSEHWRNMWSTGKEKMFGDSPISFTEDQKTLISYSRMYDNIFESPECPSEDIINDDDVLDGWMIDMRRTREGDKKKQELDRLLGDKIKDSDDIFVPANSQHGVLGNKTPQEIFDMNTGQARGIKNARDRALQQQGELKETQLPDVAQGIMLQRNQI